MVDEVHYSFNIMTRPPRHNHHHHHHHHHRNSTQSTYRREGAGEMEKEWIVDLEAELKRVDPSAESEKRSTRSICRVPKVLRNINNDAFTPQVVSFGPYHHGLPQLKPMEHHKLRALFNYLKRCSKTLEEVVEAMRPQARDLMAAYDRLKEPWSDEDRFLELIILDGCFFLDTIIWHTVDYGRSYNGIWLWTDRIMLENQLPLAVLATLMELGGTKGEDISRYLRPFDHLSKLDDLSSVNIEKLGLHHLDLYRKHRIWEGEYRFDCENTIASATELTRFGVRFEKSKTDSLTDVDFRRGVLSLPTVSIEEVTEPVFLNLLAFEQMHPDIDKGVTSYIFLMDNLINTAEDVALLKEKGLLGVWVGNDEHTADLFDRLAKQIILSAWTSVTVNKNIRQYCRRRWPKLRATVIRIYLSPPIFLSMLGGLFLLIMTIVQTVYSILSYY